MVLPTKNVASRSIGTRYYQVLNTEKKSHIKFQAFCTPRGGRSCGRGQGLGLVYAWQERSCPHAHTLLSFFPAASMLNCGRIRHTTSYCLFPHYCLFWHYSVSTCLRHYYGTPYCLLQGHCLLQQCRLLQQHSLPVLRQRCLFCGSAACLRQRRLFAAALPVYTSTACLQQRCLFTQNFLLPQHCPQRTFHTKHGRKRNVLVIFLYSFLMSALRTPLLPRAVRLSLSRAEEETGSSKCTVRNAFFCGKWGRVGGGRVLICCLP